VCARARMYACARVCVWPVLERSTPNTRGNTYCWDTRSEFYTYSIG